MLFFFFQWLFLHVSLFSSLSLFSCPIFWFHFIFYMFFSLSMFVSLFSCPICLVSLIFFLNHLILHCNVAFKSSAHTQFKIGVMFMNHDALLLSVHHQLFKLCTSSGISLSTHLATFYLFQNNLLLFWLMFL